MSRKRTQFGRIPTAVVTSGILGQLTPAACRVYLCLCARADRHWQTDVGMRRLGEDTGHHTGTASEAIGELRDFGLIKTSEYISGIGYTYTINTDRSAVAERLTVRETPNTSDENRSANGGGTVRQMPKTPFGKSRTKQSKKQSNTTEGDNCAHNGGTKTPPPNAPPSAGPNGKQTAFAFQTTDGPWSLTSAQRDDLRGRFPMVHVDTELAGLADWTEANPDRRKKPGAMHGWLRSRLASKQAQRPLSSPAYYDGFAHKSLPTDPTPEELDRILADD